ncbi:cell wall hydrolase [Aureimonas sp. SA4125]|uniref:cell wall hydrolase n=1 Tax=Aureimonas sp. SA4125 TaxID=2826993 RepID=UPI001CC3A797|nr:cell wall hydrolase [Aureimonas sp. SA4125]
MLASCARQPTMMSAEECMTRVMYFESNRSSEAGMLAVGTVVMNRMKSGKYPKTVCGVVGQKKQFAPGVLSKPMGAGRALAAKTAKLVLKGGKHPAVGRAMFFHTAGYSYPYSNMHYVTIAGGNAFYEKRKDATSSQADVARREAAGRAGRLPYDPPQRQAVRQEIRPSSEAPADLVFEPAVIPEPGSQPVFGRVTLAPDPVVEPAPVHRSAPAAARVRVSPVLLDPMNIEDVIRSGG